MEKVNVEELKEILGGEALRDDELEQVSGGMMTLKYCHDQCDRKFPKFFQRAEKNKCYRECAREFRG